MKSSTEEIISWMLDLPKRGEQSGLSGKNQFDMKQDLLVWFHCYGVLRDPTKIS